MGQCRSMRSDPGGSFLARLVAELGRAAEDGWGPTLRWLVFLIFLAALVGGAAVLTVSATDEPGTGSANGASTPFGNEMSGA